MTERCSICSDLVDDVPSLWVEFLSPLDTGQKRLPIVAVIMSDGEEVDATILTKEDENPLRHGAVSVVAGPDAWGRWRAIDLVNGVAPKLH